MRGGPGWPEVGNWLADAVAQELTKSAQEAAQELRRQLAAAPRVTGDLASTVVDVVVVRTPGNVRAEIAPRASQQRDPYHSPYDKIAAIRAGVWQGTYQRSGALTFEAAGGEKRVSDLDAELAGSVEKAQTR